jgi:uncharacterized protein involved in outer membrane biogenesis
MAKLLKWALIIIGSALALLIVGSIILTLFLPLDKIKDFAVARLSAALQREVRIEKVSFNIFSGVKLEKLYVGNRRGFADRPFVSADAVELRYAFWPLFSRQLLIKEVRLVKPEVLVEKTASGEFNFSDLLKTTQPPNNQAAEPSTTGTAKLPFTLLVSSFGLTDGKVVYVDRGTNTTNEIRNFNMKFSGFELFMLKPVAYRVSADLLSQGRPVPISVSGKLVLDLEKASLSLPDTKLTVAGETAAITASVNNWKSPAVAFSIATNSFSVDPFLALFASSSGAKKAPAKPGELTATVNKALASLPRNLRVNGSLDLSNLTFQKFKVDKANLALALAGKVLNVRIKEIKLYDGSLSGSASANLNVPGVAYSVSDLRLSHFNAAPFSTAVVGTFLTFLPDYKDLLDKVYGTLDLSAALQGRGLEPKDIMANLSLDGSLTLKNGELKRLKTLAEVGKTLKSNSLQDDIKFGALYTAFSFKNQVATAKALKIEEKEFKLYFNGGADLKTFKWVPGNRLTLKLAPALTAGLPKELAVFRDSSGWLELTFEITGDLKKPLPRPILAKPLETAIGKLKVKIEAKKVEIETAAQKAAQEKLDAETARLKEEAKNQLQQLFKH